MKTKPVPTKNIAPAKANTQLKTEPPISEKDEVKKAEERTRKAAKNSPNLL